MSTASSPHGHRWNDPDVQTALQEHRDRAITNRRTLLNGLHDNFLNEALALRLARSERIDPNAWDDNAWTALHWAVHRQYPAVVSVLLERGVSVHEQDDTGCAAFDRLMLNHLALDPAGHEPPSDPEVQLLRVLLPAGAHPVVILRPPRPINGITKNEHLNYVKAWRHSALSRGIEAVRLALEVETVRKETVLLPRPRSRL